jgi:3-methyladenine DNA glycosylase/8-oxoguanine DNA glycosylase
MENLKEDFYTQIIAELEYCNSDITPTICFNYSNLHLRQSLVETIAETVLNQKISISQAIVEVEKLYSLNNLD